MSDGLPILRATKDDVSKLLMSKAHLGAKNCNHQMSKYVHKRRQDGVHIINVNKIWEKILLAARVIIAVENPADVVAISGRTIGQRAVLKFAKHVGATPLAGRFTPGTFTNQIQKAFMEPRLLVVTDPLTDHQPIREASYVNIPTIGLCDTDTPIRYVDIVIPTNNKGVHSVGTIWWMLARECLRFRGTILRDSPWDVMVDLYFYRDPEEVEKEEQAAKEAEELAAAAEQEQSQQWDSAAPAIAAPDAAATGAEWSADADVVAAAQSTATSVATFTTTSTVTEWGASEAGWSEAQQWDA